MFKFNRPNWGLSEMSVAFFVLLPTCQRTVSHYSVTQYEIIVPHALTFALVFAALLKRSTRFAAAITWRFKSRQKRHWFHKSAGGILAGGPFLDSGQWPHISKGPMGEVPLNRKGRLRLFDWGDSVNVLRGPCVIKALISFSPFNPAASGTMGASQHDYRQQ